jgi:hypothetical protein
MGISNIIEVGDGLTINNSYGNPGNLLVSMGSGSLPQWVPGFQRIIGHWDIKIPISQTYGQNTILFSTTLGELVPGNRLIVEAFFPLISKETSVLSYPVDIYLGDSESQKILKQTLFFGLNTLGPMSIFTGEGYQLNTPVYSTDCLPPMTFSFNSDPDSQTTQTLFIILPEDLLLEGWNAENTSGSMDGYVTVYEIN